MPASVGVPLSDKVSMEVSFRRPCTGVIRIDHDRSVNIFERFNHILHATTCGDILGLQKKLVGFLAVCATIGSTCAGTEPSRKLSTYKDRCTPDQNGREAR